MAQIKRTPANQTNRRNVGTGVYLGRVISHLDPTFMGGLEITLLREQGNDLADANQVYQVRYASPFFGSTAYEFLGKNTTSPTATQDGNVRSTTSEAYNDTQKSYGMWMVPPDVGVTVLCVFVDGDPSQGFWLACVPPRFANHMVPAIGASEALDISTADDKRFNSRIAMPVAEINKKLNSLEQRSDVDSIKKPIHPIAEAFLTQGLLEDDIRGITTTSARREVPSAVFGISTPGPVDRRNNAKRSPIGKLQGPSDTPVPVSRLGGTQLVMDDGDDRYQRTAPAGELGQGNAYVDILKGKKGDPTIPYSEYFRVRTRTGHQLLMHNSEDLIYIGNARGTTWIELTSNGKIDIYAQDSISIHTETDLNIRADRDINLEAGRNINMKAVSGRTRTESAQNWEVIAGQDGKITIGKNFEQINGGSAKFTTSQGYDLRTGGANKFTASGTTDIKSGGNITQSGAVIHLNGPSAALADEATPLAPLSTHQSVATSTTAGWSENKYKTGMISSIMKRVPMHEPWKFHENIAPDALTPAKTDRET
jgi:hypothetical protein